ncbi:SDR family oxidoreductase [Skermanella mucosa]|uniref:SDR family NAD(P)-dependent oxidoreductase n=1 Tax=Skermanella mucosa TaxID=1789672 RepID=UPI00192C6418|nr:SDR family oxidoreductase [Skermanella mucosa]UEM19294.1 SDR family oxidoreductase [Skermanella mucosa]
MADVTVADIEAARGAARYPSLDGRAVLITGGASGIGASTVAHYAVQGAKVGFIDRDEAAAEGLLATLREAGVAAPLFVACDLTDISAARDAARRIEGELGPIRVLVNNAARDDRHTIAEVTPEYWDDRFNVNLRHQFFMAQAVAPGMAEAGGGSIVNLGSTSWYVCTDDLAVYQAAKAGALGLTRALARDLGPSGIRVNHVAPGWIMTERQKSLWVTPEKLEGNLARQCLKEELKPHDVARMVLFLGADDSRMCSAQTFIVDAGTV